MRTAPNERKPPATRKTPPGPGVRTGPAPLQSETPSYPQANGLQANGNGPPDVSHRVIHRLADDVAGATAIRRHSSLTFTIPIHTESMSNARLHWAVKAKKVKAQRAATAHRTPPSLRALGPLLVVTLTRVSPRELDDDNLRGALKGVRDQVASALGVDDGSKLVRWDYGQEKGEPCVRVDVRTEAAL